MVIAIDGPAGSGKSTISELLAARLNFTYINSGNLYRALTFGCIIKAISVEDREAALRYAQTVKFDYYGKTVLLDGEDITRFLHSDDVEK
ncbi:MAG: (d)CMP kinase, partial [Spirochaetaceae bacterium]|nr:(d)CMP kinase [Spirochaetaceae bacterium]